MMVKVDIVMVFSLFSVFIEIILICRYSPIQVFMMYSCQLRCMHSLINSKKLLSNFCVPSIAIGDTAVNKTDSPTLTQFVSQSLFPFYCEIKQVSPFIKDHLTVFSSCLFPINKLHNYFLSFHWILISRFFLVFIKTYPTYNLEGSLSYQISKS